MAIRRKSIIFVTGIVAAVIVVAVWLLANPDRYRREIISYLEAKNREADRDRSYRSNLDSSVNPSRQLFL